MAPSSLQRIEAGKAGRKIERVAVAFEAGRDGFWLARWLRARGIEAHVIHSSSVAVSREHKIERVAVAFEAGRDGFWLARWLRARGIEAHVIHSSSVAVSREHRRAKTDRLDTELLKRAFLGWLRGERDHCKMVAIPTIEDEDGKRPNRERENLVREQTRIVNRMKAALSRLGIRGFNPKLKKAAERLEYLRTPEGEPIPPNTLAELRRDMERRRLVRDQIRQIEDARLGCIEHASNDGPHAMVRAGHRASA
jgi:transposase